jgi:hypothetical protein
VGKRTNKFHYDFSPESRVASATRHTITILEAAFCLWKALQEAVGQAASLPTRGETRPKLAASVTEARLSNRF